MIPQRIKLSGFLSHRGEGELSFTGAPVWMLAGRNGAGKSSIFDALTYALFGHHRGGSQSAVELINKESNALAVEFDFLLDGQLFRIRRTLKRSKAGSATGTQQVFRLLDGEDWIAVEDTNKKVDFDKWIHERIGLNYETFTSSVLLLQGKAEKLLDSKPSGRAEVLAGIVDLERYQRLHEKANRKKLVLKGQLDSLKIQSEGVPEVTDLEYAEALEAIERADAARTDAARKLDELRELEIQARKWADAETRLTETRGKLKQAEYLLASAVKIEKAHARLVELRDALPAAHAVVTTRNRLLESDQKTERLTRERDEAVRRNALAEASLKTAKQKRETLRTQLDNDQKQLDTGVSRLRELSGLLKTVELVEEQQARLDEFDRRIAEFPGDPATEAARAQAEVERLTELVRVLPILQRVHDERNDLKASTQKSTASESRLSEIRVVGETKRAAMKSIERERESVGQARAEADDRAAGAAVLARQAADRLAEFASLSGEKSCRACGQELTPEHFADEKAQREREAEEARRQRETALAEQAAARERERIALEVEATAKSELDRLRDDYRDADAEKKQAAADTLRHLRVLKLAFAELPPAFSRRIADREPDDWTRTRFPERDELSNLSHEAAGLDAAKRTQKSARDLADNWKLLQSERETALKSLARLRASVPSGEIERLREEYGHLQAAERSLRNAIHGAKAGIESVEDEIDRHGKEAHAATTVRTEIVGRLHAEDVTRTHCRETIDREMRKLSADWQAMAGKAGLNEYHAWKSEHDALVSDETEATYKKLEIARGGLEALRAEIRLQEASSADFPEPARQHPDAVKMQIVAARGDLDDKDRELNAARQRKVVFDGHRERRAELGDQYLLVDAEWNRFKNLSELLGRDRLQRHLVRRAERQIVDCANGVLDRLSGGQLFLKLVGSDDGAEADRALDLECANRAAGGSPINVMFLSGSQKFRVAVSLALGIGQYASRQHRPIESVIIDEGFGCLDRQGRQTMIQELRNLGGHLHCILLVSHQEEFAEAFPDGYRFELVDGATQVARFQP